MDGIIPQLRADEEGMFDFVNSLSRYVMGFTSNSLPRRIKMDKFRQQGILVQVELIGIRYHSQALRLSSCLLRVSHSVKGFPILRIQQLVSCLFHISQKNITVKFFLCLCPW